MKSPLYQTICVFQKMFRQQLTALAKSEQWNFDLLARNQKHAEWYLSLPFWSREVIIHPGIPIKTFLFTIY